MFLWKYLILMLISYEAIAGVETIKVDYPIYGNGNYKVVTLWDPVDFKGFLTQGIKITMSAGKPFDIIYSRTTYNIHEAMLRHEDAKNVVIAEYIQSRMTDRTVPILSPTVSYRPIPSARSSSSMTETPSASPTSTNATTEFDEFYDIMDPIPEQYEEEQL